MCEQLTQITPNYQGHVIFCCEHGSFHLVWDRTTFLLDQEELSALFTLVQQIDKPNAVYSNWIASIQSYISANNTLSIELWLLDRGIRLSSSEFELMCVLLQDAIDWLVCQTAATRKTTPVNEASVLSLNHHIPAQKLFLN